MTENNTPDTPSAAGGINHPDELQKFLSGYRPQGVDPDVWAQVATAANALVMRAGALTRLRVEKDIQLLGAVVAHLVDRGRPVTLEEALSDATELSFDTALRVSKKTRENKRGILRRLQAVHRGLPWRTERRVDGARVEDFVSHTAADTMRRILATARATAAQDLDGVAFVTSVEAARALRSGQPAMTASDKAVWSRARGFAQRHGWHLTQPVLRAAVTHEVLDRPAPIAVLIAEHALTRRDLDLALTRMNDLPVVPTNAHIALLRGRPVA